MDSGSAELREVQLCHRLQSSLRVRKRHSAMLLARSAPEGEADEIGAKADIAARTSAVGGKADVTATWPRSPLLARSRPRHVYEG